MNILLFTFDTVIPNLALEKLSAYHLQKGDNVILNNFKYADEADKIYISNIFTWNTPKYSIFSKYKDKVFFGGSGYSLKTTLPPEIDSIKPHINLGFTTRGCIRRCKFCIVPEKEGKIKPVGNLRDLWNGKDKDIILLDNNILALPEHFNSICHEAQNIDVRLNFYQGLDFRLLNEINLKLLKATRHKPLRFAWDNYNDVEIVESKLKLLFNYNVFNSQWFILVGFNTNFIEDVFRATFLKKFNQRVYAARYNYNRDKRYIPLCRWINNPKRFFKMTFDEFLKLPENRCYKNFNFS